MPAVDLSEPVQSDELLKAALSFLDASKQHLGDPTIQTIAVEGDFAESILKVATENSAEIIVLGLHSRSALEKILMGSVTEKLLHDSHIPLFIVPTRRK